MDEFVKDYLKKNVTALSGEFKFFNIHKDVSSMYKRFRDNKMDKRVYNMLLATTLSGLALDNTRTIDEGIGVLKQSIKMLEDVDREVNL